MASKPLGSGSDCIEQTRDSKVKVSEPGTGRAAVLLNADRAKVRRIRMDGCLAPTGQVSADWIVSKARVVDVIVELKGKNVNHAVRQIEATRNYWPRRDEYVDGQVIGAWIICTEYPRASTKVARFRERLRTEGVVMIVSTHNGEERPFSDFVPRRP